MSTNIEIETACQRKCNSQQESVRRYIFFSGASRDLGRLPLISLNYVHLSLKNSWSRLPSYTNKIILYICDELNILHLNFLMHFTLQISFIFLKKRLKKYQLELGEKGDKEKIFGGERVLVRFVPAVRMIWSLIKETLITNFSRHSFFKILHNFNLFRK